MATTAPKPPAPARPHRQNGFAHEALCWLRYLYLLRFSILLWCFPVVLILLNWKAKSLGSGLMVPEFFAGYLCVGFFVLSTGYAALISSRVTVVNGPRRFAELAPRALQSLLDDPENRHEGLVFTLAHVWTAVLLLYLLAFCPDNEGQSRTMIGLGFTAGVVTGMMFWYVINAWYYLAYEPITRENLAEEEEADGRHAALKAAPRTGEAARTMIYPRTWFFLAEQKGLEAARIRRGLLRRVLGWFAGKLEGTPGFAYRTKSGPRLYEGHAFLLFCAFGFVCLYLAIWPIAAPVPALWPSLTALGLGLVGVLASIREFWSARLEGSGLLEWKIGLSLGVVGFWWMFAWLYLGSSAERFPILATVLVMVIALLWALSALGFFLDRYRVPVLFVMVLVLLVFHVRVPFGLDEHYFSTVPLDPPVAVGDLPTPAAVLDERMDSLGVSEPLVVVTATGGGLHASAWTTAVLAQLEQKFAESGLPPFHQRLLLLSTVSGGSVGLNAYLHALKDGSIASQSGQDHVQQVSQCSSLEAVGWGLVYFDFPKSILPLGPELLWPSTGNGDLADSPLFMDRTWALRKGIERNQSNAWCELVWQRDADADRAKLQDHEGGDAALAVPPRRIVDWSGLFQDGLARNLRDRDAEAKREAEFTLTRLLPGNVVPAFSMNTTSVEEGSRFLLSNYVVPHYLLDASDGNVMYPAQSFLDTFRETVNGHVVDAIDLPLATAAQLSATFPYVSSTTRAPNAYAGGGRWPSLHFGDGGYFDNDGTVSAIEFLRYALAPEEGGATGTDRRHLADIHRKLTSPLRILWIEIRNSGDDDGGKPQEAGGNGAGKSPWTMLDQVGAPITTFWNAGHESVTGRNRHAMDLLQEADGCELSIYRIVFADENARKVTQTDPLNWSLTPAQRQEVRFSARRDNQLKGKYQAAVDAFRNWNGPHPCAARPDAQAHAVRR